MSIVTKLGDTGTTSLCGGVRVSKSDLRVEAYGAIDETIAAIGVARAICNDEKTRDRMKEIQRELFLVSSVVATRPGNKAPVIDTTFIEALTADVHRLEKINGILADWSVPGEDPASAALDLARTVCRRAERAVVRLRESGQSVGDAVVVYLNRLSDFLWISGRAIELKKGIDSSLRRKSDPRKPWSRAW
jgi:cob(I)alamin adenosyltransferase